MLTLRSGVCVIVYFHLHSVYNVSLQGEGNEDIAETARRLYGNIENLELYVRIVCHSGLFAC